MTPFHAEPSSTHPRWGRHSCLSAAASGDIPVPRADASRLHQGNPRRRAFFLTDSIVGFMLVGVLGLILVVAVTTATKAQHRLDDASAAAIAAEQTMSLLRDGQPAPPSLREAKIEMKPTEGGAPVPGHRWVEVTATQNGRTASLIGMVPEGARR